MTRNQLLCCRVRFICLIPRRALSRWWPMAFQSRTASRLGLEEQWLMCMLSKHSFITHAILINRRGDSAGIVTPTPTVYCVRYVGLLKGFEYSDVLAHSAMHSTLTLRLSCLTTDVYSRLSTPGAPMEYRSIPTPMYMSRVETVCRLVDVISRNEA